MEYRWGRSIGSFRSLARSFCSLYRDSCVLVLSGTAQVSHPNPRSDLSLRDDKLSFIVGLRESQNDILTGLYYTLFFRSLIKSSSLLFKQSLVSCIPPDLILYHHPEHFRAVSFPHDISLPCNTLASQYCFSPSWCFHLAVTSILLFDTLSHSSTFFLPASSLIPDALSDAKKRGIRRHGWDRAR